MDFKRELLLKVLDEAFHPLRQVFVRGVGDLQIEGGQMPVGQQLHQPPGIDVTRRHPLRQNRESGPLNGGLTQSGDGGRIARFTPTLDSFGRAWFDFTVTSPNYYFRGE